MTSIPAPRCEKRKGSGEKKGCSRNGPCHSDEERKQFWTDVLHLSYSTLFAEARRLNEECRLYDEEDFVADLDDRIEEIKKGVGLA